MVTKPTSNSFSWRNVNSVSLEQYASFGNEFHCPLSSMQYTPDGRYGLSIADGIQYRFRMVNMLTGTIDCYDTDGNFGGELITFYWVSNTEFVVVSFLSVTGEPQLFEQRRYQVCHHEKKVALTCLPLAIDAYYENDRIEFTAEMPWKRGASKIVSDKKAYVMIPNNDYLTLVPWDPQVHQVQMAVRFDIGQYWRCCSNDIEFELLEVESPFTYGSKMYFPIRIVDAEGENKTIEASLEYMACIDLEDYNLEPGLQRINDDIVLVELVKFDQIMPGNFSITPKYTVFQQDHYIVIKERVFPSPGLYQEKDLNDSPCEVFVMDLEKGNVSRTMIDMNRNSSISLYKSALLVWMDSLNAKEYSIDFKMKIQQIQNKNPLSLLQIAKNALLAKPSNSNLPECWFPIYFESF